MYWPIPCTMLDGAGGRISKFLSVCQQCTLKEHQKFQSNAELSRDSDYVFIMEIYEIIF